MGDLPALKKEKEKTNKDVPATTNSESKKKAEKQPEKKAEKQPEKKAEKQPEKKPEKKAEKKETSSGTVKVKNKEKFVDAARGLLLALMPDMRAKFLDTYPRSMNAHDVERLEIEVFFSDQRFAGVCENDPTSNDLYMCAKLLYELLQEYKVDKGHKADKKHKVDYNKFIEDFEEKIWQPFCEMDFFKDAKAHTKYWDRDEGDVYNLKIVKDS